MTTPTPREPNDVELRARIRKWLRYLHQQSGLRQKDIAEALDFSEATISNLLRDKEEPGLDCLVRMHFRLGGDLQQMVRYDPPAARTGLTVAKK